MVVFQQVVGLLTNHFRSLTNPAYERAMFKGEQMEPGESVVAFVTRLKGLAVNYGFQDVDVEIRDQLLFRISNAGLKRKLLEEPNLTLARALAVVRADEAVREQVADLGKVEAAVTAKMEDRVCAE